MSLTRKSLSRTAAFAPFVLALFVSCFPASAVAQAGAAAVRLTQPVDETQLVTLKGTMHPLATKANDRGVVDDGFAVERVQVLLKRSPAQETALQQLLQQMHQPGSASYHKWLTPAQFGEEFGPSDADIATISSWLGMHGLTVTKVNPGRQTLEFSGSAGQFKKTFHTEIHKFQVNGQVHTANASDPSIPAALAPVFGGFASLNNFPLRSYAKVLGHATYDPATHKTVPEWTVGDPTDGYNFVLAPGDFAVQYDLNPLYKAGTNGAGQTIGIINEANISVPLVNQYRALFGLPANAPNVIIDGDDPGIDGANNPGGPNGASVEAYLDVEQAGAVAPGATIDLIIAADTALASGLGIAAEHAVYGNVAPVLSLSFGQCEASSASNNQFFNGLWEQAAAQGQTVMVSTGDAGSAGCDNDNTQEYAVFGQQINGIASTPWNVGVGGTDFYYSSYAGTTYTNGNPVLSEGEQTQLQQYWGTPTSNASNMVPTTTLQSKIPEQPWNDSQFGLNLYNEYSSDGQTSIGGGGGGASNCATGTYPNSCAGNPKPAWQTGTGVPADGVRDLPDVSLFAANGNNYSFYPICAVDGDCQQVSSGTVQFTGVGGTSASSPAFAGIMALVNQKYGPQGQADYVLYPLAKQFPNSFNDVTVGTNAVPCNLQTVSAGGNSYPPADCLATGTTYTVTDGTFGQSTEGEIGNTTTKVAEYNAGVGYDLATGLGTIDATNLVTNWGNVKFTSSSVTLSLGTQSTTFAHGTPVAISGAVTPGTATGAVSLETTSTEPLQAAETVFSVGANGAYAGTVSFLPGGTYEIYATYGGDGTYGASTSSKTSITVTPETSATTLYAYNYANALTGSQTPAYSNRATIAYGTQLLLTAIPAAATQATTSAPTGSVIFMNGTTQVGTAQVDATGVATLNYAPAASTTQYSITAQYSGDASYGPSTSAPFTFVVNQDNPVVSFESSTQIGSTVSAVSGESLLSVQLENSANLGSLSQYGSTFTSRAIAPTGVVTVTGLPSGTLTFPALASAVNFSQQIEGVATVALPTEAAGTYSLSIGYPGDANYAPVSQAASIAITAATGIPTTTTASIPAVASSSSGPNISFTVTGTPAGGFPSGTVNLFASGVEIASVTTPSSGTGDTYSASGSLNGGLLAGANQIIVQYSGNTTYAPSSTVVNIENGGAPTFLLGGGAAIGLVSGVSGTGTSNIAVTPLNGFTGSVAFTCTVAPSNGAGTPTCTVTTPVSLNGTAASPVTLSVSTTSSTLAGSYVVTVTGTAAGLVQTVTVPVTVNSILLLNSGAITIASPGGSGTSTITVNNVGSIPLSGIVLSCAVTGNTSNDPPACSLSALAASSNAPGQAASTLTVTTTGGSAALELPRLRMLPIGGGLAAAALLFFLVPGKRRRLGTLLGLMVLMAGIGVSAGCGSGGSSSSSGNPGTPQGTYTVTITGTANGGPISPTTVKVTVN